MNFEQHMSVFKKCGDSRGVRPPPNFVGNQHVFVFYQGAFIQNSATQLMNYSRTVLGVSF